jgi:hypothetical protein
MVVLAPISTSSSIWTIPTWGIFMFYPAGPRKAESVAPHDDACVEDNPLPDPH